MKMIIFTNCCLPKQLTGKVLDQILVYKEAMVSYHFNRTEQQQLLFLDTCIALATMQ